MTEAEAKTKWCPMVRATYFDQAVGLWTGPANAQSMGKVGDLLYGGKCIGSACMMWRWNTKYTPPPYSMMATYPQPEGTTEISATEGYCGLAGKP